MFHSGLFHASDYSLDDLKWSVDCKIKVPILGHVTNPGHPYCSGSEIFPFKDYNNKNLQS